MKFLSRIQRISKQHLYLAFLIFTCFAFGTDSIWAQKIPVELSSKKVVSPTYKPPTTGILSLVCNTPSAEVLLNAKSRGSVGGDGKFSLKSLNKGTYKLEVRAADYEPFLKDVVIAPGRSEIIPVELIPNFGYLTLSNVSLKPNAKYTVEVDGKPLDPANIELQGRELRLKIAPTGERQVKIVQGTRTIVPAKLYKVDARIQKVEQVEPLKAVLIIDTLPKASVYADDIFCGEASGEGTLTIDKLSPDEPHRIRIEADRYRTFETDVELRTDVDSKLPAKLEAIIEFADLFTDLNKWDAPADWKAETQLLKVRGAQTIGMPKEVGFRNCEVAFDLQLVKGGRASWVIHAKDTKKDYYLFTLELSGPTAMLKTFVCRDGIPGTPVQTDFIPVPVAEKKWHHFRILVEGNKISHLVTPNESPDEYSVSLFQDRDNTFPYGSIGFATLQGEEFWVGAFVVCPEGAGCRPEMKAAPVDSLRKQK